MFATFNSPVAQQETQRLLCYRISKQPTHGRDENNAHCCSNIINNARFIGDRLRLTHQDTLCCPPPLFHCFGLVLGLLVCLTHATKIALPSETFDPSAVMAALAAEKCTALHGVPAMFEAVIGQPRPADFDPTRLRTGIIAGAPVPRYLMKKLVEDLGMKEYTSSYGNFQRANPDAPTDEEFRAHRNFADLLQCTHKRHPGP